MIPIDEHHGATGAWNDLQKWVDYWMRSDIVAVLKKHQEYLLINIVSFLINVTAELLITGGGRMGPST
jgi:hypothetical protein